MSEQELKQWFIEKLDNCYQTEIKNDIYFVYDKNYIRQKKLGQMIGEKIYPPNKIKGEILFKVSIFDYCFICNYEKIYRKIYYFNGQDFIITNEFIKNIIDNYDSGFKNLVVGCQDENMMWKLKLQI